MGLCKILEVKRNGNTFAVQVECSGPAGNQMLGNVTFTMREDQTIDFSDQDQSYKSVLHRCP
jgi:ABC-type antimicrobial peptide transport system ATPase subunit